MEELKLNKLLHKEPAEKERVVHLRQLGFIRLNQPFVAQGGEVEGYPAPAGPQGLSTNDLLVEGIPSWATISGSMVRPCTRKIVL